MNRYDELEKLYYKKKFKKIFFFFLVFIIFVFMMYYFIAYIKPFKKIIFKTKKTVLQKKQKPIKDVNNTVKIKKEIKKHNMAHKNIQKETNNQLKFILPDINSTADINSTIKQNKKIIQKTKTIPQKKLIKKTPNTTVNLNKIKIIEISVNEKALIKKYKKAPNYDLAIMISQAYLKKNKLSQAQNWALKANTLNADKPDSWILFSDILIKKHNIKKAKEILKAYINSYGPNDIIDKKLRSIDEN